MPRQRRIRRELLAAVREDISRRRVVRARNLVVIGKEIQRYLIYLKSLVGDFIEKNSVSGFFAFKNTNQSFLFFKD